MELALKLLRELERFRGEYGTEPEIIILKNHGLIATANGAAEVIRLTEAAVLGFEKLLGADLSRFKSVSALSAMLKAAGCAPAAVYRSSDADLLEALKKKKPLFFSPPAAPDTLVFCGMNTVEVLPGPRGAAALARYAGRYGEPPKVIIRDGQLFFTARNMKKAREAEEVYKAHILALMLSKGKARPLSRTELRYLSRWEAEKFRQGA